MLIDKLNVRVFLVLLLKFYKIFLEDLTCLCTGKAFAPRSGMHVEAYVKVEYFLLIYLLYFDNILNEIASMQYGCRLGLATVIECFSVCWRCGAVGPFYDRT